MDQQIDSRLTDEEIAKLDPNAFMAILGKRVIHPGGRRSTEELFQLAEFHPDHRVLEIGCGVGTTAVEIATRYECHVTAIDVDPLMLVRAEAAVREAGIQGRVRIEKADIQAMPFVDDSFDRVVVEAVTIFVDRPCAAREVIRVCRPGGGECSNTNSSTASHRRRRYGTRLRARCAAAFALILPRNGLSFMKRRDSAASRCERVRLP